MLKVMSKEEVANYVINVFVPQIKSGKHELSIYDACGPYINDADINTNADLLEGAYGVKAINVFDDSMSWNSDIYFLAIGYYGGGYSIAFTLFTDTASSINDCKEQIMSYIDNYMGGVCIVELL